MWNNTFLRINRVLITSFCIQCYNILKPFEFHTFFFFIYMIKWWIRILVTFVLYFYTKNIHYILLTEEHFRKTNPISPKIEFKMAHQKSKGPYETINTHTKTKIKQNSNLKRTSNRIENIRIITQMSNYQSTSNYLVTRKLLS